MLRLPLVLLLALVALAPVTTAQESDDVRLSEAIHLLETWLSAERDYEQIPGLSAAVVHGDELVWSGAFGYANLEEEVPASPETIYSICSISKLFTGIAAMQLRDEGRFALDDPLEMHLPWYDLPQVHTAYGPVTVRGILTHGAGIPRESAHPYWTAPDFPFPTSAEIRELLREQQSLYPAWDAFQYSNLGLTLAGDLVEELSGQPFADFVSERILVPLGMEDTAPRMPEELHGGRLAVGYSPLGRRGMREPVRLFDTRGIVAAAGFSSTVLDLARFASWQFRLMDGHADDLLAPATLREMQRVQWADPDAGVMRGLAYGVWRAGDRTMVGHGGYCPGYQSQLALHPRSRIATIFMANAMGLDSRKFADVAHSIVAGALSANGSEESTNRLPEEHEGLVGRYGSLWGEVAILPWNGELHALFLPSSDPVGSLTRLRHEEGTTFRRIRADGEPGEEWLFDTDEAGRGLRIWYHSNPMSRLD